MGLVPRVKASGGKSRSGHITRESRKLTRRACGQEPSLSFVDGRDRVYREASHSSQLQFMARRWGLDIRQEW
jgi:hypothetical protein